ncbi:MAG: Rieske 2Fe-2S domain-containing protein [Frankiaceae bacterium]
MSQSLALDLDVPASGAAGYCLGALADIPVGEGRAYAVAGQQIAVFRSRDGNVYALQAVCPHAGGPLADGLLDARVVVCPLHNNAFELATGQSVTGQPAVRTYPLSIDEAGRITVRLS